MIKYQTSIRWQSSGSLWPRRGGTSIVSDDSAPELNTTLWTVVNPLGDGSYRMTGTQLALTVPAGVHDITTTAIKHRVMQSIDDANSRRSQI